MVLIIMKILVTLASCLDASLSQFGIIGNEVSQLEEKLDLEDINIYLDAGKGRRVRCPRVLLYVDSRNTSAASSLLESRSKFVADYIENLT